MKSRRRFLSETALGAAACFTPFYRSEANESPASPWPIAVFEKVFEALSYEELAGAIAAIGADGIEATIRPGGHIEPDAAADEVPKMNAALAKHGKRIVIAATHIQRADQPHAESFLRTLHSNGITHYRMGYYRLDLSKPMVPQLREYTSQAQDLAALNEEIGIQGLYQNHSGSNKKRGYLGALGWDLAMLLDDVDPAALGIALDTRHLRKDTGSSWYTAVAACKPHIRSIYVKDGLWHGERGDQYKDVALDTGFVNEEVFNHIRSGLPPMPLCIHMEWLGYRVFEKSETPQAIEAHQRDIQALRRWMG